MCLCTFLSCIILRLLHRMSSSDCFRLYFVLLRIGSAYFPRRFHGNEFFQFLTSQGVAGSKETALEVWVLGLALLLAVILSPREKPLHYFIFTELFEWVTRKKGKKFSSTLELLRESRCPF